MKITYNDVEVINSGLMAIIDQRMSGKTAIRIAKVLSELENSFQILNESRNRILLMHATKDDNGEPVMKNDGLVFEDEPALREELSSMMEEETEISSYISKTDLESLEISPKTAFALSKITK